MGVCLDVNGNVGVHASVVLSKEKFYETGFTTIGDTKGLMLSRMKVDGRLAGSLSNHLTL